jgi:hypothetical protein
MNKACFCPAHRGTEEERQSLKTAEQCASSMREIIDKATVIKGRD